MIKSIKVNLEILEQMIYFWQACADKEKVSESYLDGIANQKEMALIYDDELDAMGFRKALSAIANRERLSDATKREWKVWNNNMWVMEDKGILASMIQPVKTLNVDELAAKVNAKKDIAYEAVEIVFIPGTTEEYIINGNQLIINFFRVIADIYEEDKVTIEGKPVLDYIEEKLLEM